MALIGLNAFLLKQNYELRKASTPISAISVGTLVLPMNGADNDGHDLLLNVSSDRKTLLLVFSPTCQYCDRNSSNWTQIINASEERNLRIFGVSLQLPGAEFIKTYGWENKLPLINILEKHLQSTPPFDITPLTILVDSKGKVEKVWRGVLNQKTLAEVLSQINAVNNGFSDE